MTRNIGLNGIISREKTLPTYSCVVIAATQNTIPVCIGVESRPANVRLVGHRFKFIRPSGQHQVMKVLKGILKQRGCQRSSIR